MVLYNKYYRLYLCIIYILPDTAAYVYYRDELSITQVNGPIMKPTMMKSLMISIQKMKPLLMSMRWSIVTQKQMQKQDKTISACDTFTLIDCEMIGMK